MYLEDRTVSVLTVIYGNLHFHKKICLVFASVFDDNVFYFTDELNSNKPQIRFASTKNDRLV